MALILSSLMFKSCRDTSVFHLRLRFTILVIKYTYKVDDRIGATELIIKLKPKLVER